MSLIIVYEMYCSTATQQNTIQYNATKIINMQAMKIISTVDACTEHQHLWILECQCMYMAKVKH